MRGQPKGFNCGLSVLERTLPHLAKRPSDLKQNGTQEKTPVYGKVFHTLSPGVSRFFCES